MPVIPTVSPQYIAQCREQVYSSDLQVVHKATQLFRRILSIEKNPPIQNVIECGVVPRFVEFLQYHDHPVSYIHHTIDIIINLMVFLESSI